jgi:NDP-sugar pyrophosphorylase family protein
VFPAHALVLAAGLGTRLRPLTNIRAKPAIPVAGEPLIRRIVRWLVVSGVIDVVVNLHHLPHTIAAVLGDGSDLGARVRYSWEQPVVLGSAGGPRQALPILGAGTFVIVNGDTLTSLDLGALAEHHARSGALVTLALVPNTEPDRYGGVLLDGEQSVTGFVRRGPGARGSYHFVGVQIADARAFADVLPAVPENSIGASYDRLIAREPGSIRGYVCKAEFHDIGTVADYWRTSVRLSPSPIDSILWDEVAVGAGAVLDECIVTDGVTVEPGTRHHRQILMRGPDGRTVAEPLILS